MKRLPRLLAALLAALAACIGFASASGAEPPRVSRPAALIGPHEAWHRACTPSESLGERGPPSVYDQTTTDDAVGRWSRGASAYAEGSRTRGATIYNDPTVLVQRAQAGRTSQEQARAEAGPPSSLEPSDVAANTARRFPLGFATGQQFDSAVAGIRSAAGVDDALIGVRGSAATGISAKRGVVGPDIGDIDFFIVSDTLHGQGVAAGARATNGALRVSATQRFFPDIASVEQQLTERLGYKTTVRIFSSDGWSRVRTGMEVYE